VDVANSVRVTFTFFLVLGKFIGFARMAFRWHKLSVNTKYIRDSSHYANRFGKRVTARGSCLAYQEKPFGSFSLLFYEFIVLAIQQVVRRAPPN
jgi:hypothetical protein